MMGYSNNELKQFLSEMGFSAKEADVYLAILILGRGTASKIAREAHVLRTTVYDILSSLFSKGLVTLTGKEPKQEYVALSPDKLKDYIKNELEQKQKDFRQAETILIPQIGRAHV